jgi:3-hydroxyisobutyrate dehydrogenase-like beta-hydroxyacid dehydrogenase
MSTGSEHHQVIGLVGIGLLGSALAERLILAGFDVQGHDISSAAMDHFSSLGGRPLRSLDETPCNADFIVLCLPNSNIVDSVLAVVKEQLSEHTIVIDTTTGDPRLTKQSAKSLTGLRTELVDATVLGSSEVTRQGDAVLMVGASAAAFERCRPVLQAISNSVHHVGPTGSGQEMKLVANLVLGLNRAALAEGLHFAKTLGLDLDTVLDILRSGAAWSRVMDAKGQKMVREEFEPQARLSQHLKDVRLILSRAKDAGTQLPLSALHRELLQRVEDAGEGDLDNSAVIHAW